MIAVVSVGRHVAEYDGSHA